MLHVIQERFRNFTQQIIESYRFPLTSETLIKEEPISEPEYCFQKKNQSQSQQIWDTQSQKLKAAGR